MRSLTILCALAIALLAGEARALETATFTASKTNTIGNTGDNESQSNGAGELMFAGVTPFDGVRRALIQFGLPGSNCSGDCPVPSDAVIADVRFRVYLTRVPASPVSGTFRLYELNEFWREGTAEGDATSDPEDDTEGKLANTSGGGATWIDRSWSTNWSSAGGTVESGYTSFSIGNTIDTWYSVTGSASSNTNLYNQVAAWISGSDNNYGFLLRSANETTVLSAKQFNSRHSSTGRPQLRIRYRLPQGATGCDNDDDCQGSLYCTDGVCCNASSCPAPSVCYLSGSCQAGSGTCSYPHNDGATCTDDGKICTSDVCQSGSCTHPADKGGTVCNAAGGECDIAEVCQDGSSSCPSDSVKSAGTPCSSDGLACTIDECNGSSKLCQHPVAPAGSIECRASAGVCDEPDFCDGVSSTCPADEKYGAETQCRAASCTDNTATLAEFCDGVSDSCPPVSTEDCSPNGCQGDACLGACPDDASCGAGSYCDAGVCKLKLEQGTACGRNGECQSGFCIDGYCCDSLCGGGDDTDCEACDVAGSLGTCRAASAGTVCRGSGGVCDIVETCNGGLTCPANEYQPTTEVCVPRSCSGGVMTTRTLCPGDGPACPTPDTVECHPFVCGLNRCRTSCTTDSHCAVGYYCDGNGQCLDKKTDGLTCEADHECESDHCVDGVCCDRACTGQCEACDITLGTCTTVPSGQPHGDRTPCAGDGSLCSGECDGSSATSCSFPGNSTVCRPGECSSGVATIEARCDGAGNCPTLQTQECSPFACGPTMCVADCTVHSQCAEGFYCLGGLCEPRFDDGDVCSADHECLSGFCIDGVCCDTACEGQCEACAEPGSVGRCVAVSGQPRGARAPCLGKSGSTCEGFCDGTVTRSCTYPSFGTICREASCADGVAVVEAHCNGSGACPSEVRQDCGTADCDGPMCAGECVLDIDCAIGDYCSAGVCVPQLGLGDVCGDNDGACSSGNCVDGVCCTDACEGQCEACNVAGNLGICQALVGEPPRGTRPPCRSDGSPCGGMCNGNPDGCEYPGPETECRAPTCTEGVATLAANCIGSGSCPDVQEQTCPGACSGDLCAGGCTADGDCGAGQWCSGGVCVTLLGTGDACGADTQCESGSCVDGYCCNTDCSDQCKACDVTGSLGLCTPVLGPPHGGRPQCGGIGPCAAECDGTGTPVCDFPGIETLCGVGSCSNGVASGLATCSGAGRCLGGQEEKCAPYVCAGDVCAESCANDTDCAEGFLCDSVSGACVLAPEPDAGTDGGLLDGGSDASFDSGAGGAMLPDGGLGGAPSSDGGSGGSSGGGTSGAAGTGGGSRRRSDAGTGELDAGADGGPQRSGNEGGCGCRVGGETRDPAKELLLLVAVIGLARLRRRAGGERGRA